MPAGAMPPLPRLLPLHFSLSPPPSLPPSPLPCDSLWAVQKPHALIYLFLGLAGGRCAAPRSRVGGARSQGFKYWPCRLREELLGGPQTHLATLPPSQKQISGRIPARRGRGAGREKPASLPQGERARRGAARRGAGRSATLRTRAAAVPRGAAAGPAPAGLRSCAAEGAGEPGSCLRVQPFRGARLPAGEGRKTPNNHGRLCFRHA